MKAITAYISTVILAAAVLATSVCTDETAAADKPMKILGGAPKLIVVNGYAAEATQRAPRRLLSTRHPSGRSTAPKTE